MLLQQVLIEMEIHLEKESGPDTARRGRGSLGKPYHDFWKALSTGTSEWVGARARGRTLCVAFEENRAHGIARAERADQSEVPALEIVGVLRRGDDGSRRRCVGVILEDVGLLLWGGYTAQNLFPDEVIHGLVGLVQPELFQITAVDPFIRHMIGDMSADQRQDFLKT